MIEHLNLRKVNDQWSEENMLAAAEETLRSGWYLRGEQTRKFEQAYAAYTGTAHCIGCGNGLDALTLIFRAYRELGVMKDGDEVIVPANTYIASILAITENRLVPVLVEPDIRTLQIDDTRIEEAITPRTRAIMLVHLYGCCAYTEHIDGLCRRYGLKLVEDNAQAHGCTFEGRRTGALGHAAGHSFYPTKNLGAMGDAGAVTTDDTRLADVVRALANYGSSEQYVFQYEGVNSRIDEVQSAILARKLPHLDRHNQRRKEIARLYLQHIHLKDIILPRTERDHVWHLFPVLYDRRDRLREYLMENGVQTAIHYPIPPHRQACYARWSSLSMPVTERIHREELSLPCNQTMTDEEVRTVINLVNNFG